ncbi:DUF3379 family protein [Colwellia sp. 4_MG-2023]|jgi:hypothetical protein|uniref:DUF3379 family protein n=1 Tax=unclassified Colwellia TaxID=196834 RepID=UPI002091AA56|nr:MULTISPECIES: DUF3379 family protein [unclassified Colwellia]MDO6505583.1 DUF3379 family protein [Colwellia sp. 5_MG-2023]MDO6554121.1 DUF3379 family protein [Colwellia sp. 4_MG-2023]MDO6651007.1 DUF3379 family protein [Colwellia sp. 3_MG-2023]MDO6664042.1 DUF3379 family protein [Colwellia sp. 2_MG-2023]MDO6688393.1 DUF3379 family protein [Colwellia sp. 1_MG-2023]
MKNSTTSKDMTSETKMDDLQFRRSIYADPSSLDEDIIAAQNDDPAKKQLAQELCMLDERIKQAMSIPVPDDLCDKLLLRQTLKSHQQNKRKSRIHLALAASVAIIAGIVVNYLQFSNSYNYDNLGDYALAHVYYEQGSFSNSTNAKVSLDSLNQKMVTFNGSFSDSMGELIAADYCRFDGMKSLHLVFKGVTDTVAVFVVPKKEHLEFVDKFHDDNLQGESLSYQENDIIVVANKNESLSQWQRAISNNINWSI